MQMSLQNFVYRSFPRVMAAHLHKAKPGSQRMEMLSRIYRAMKPVDQLQTKAELHAMRLARLGQLEAHCLLRLS